MKNDMKNQDHKAPDEALTTPRTPQVMDPSTKPVDEKNEKDNDNRGGYYFERKKNGSGAQEVEKEKIAPREEL